jgi:alpha-methylacyl-CoA racemase
MAALYHARTTGTGQVVDAAMTDGVISLMGMIYGDFAAGRWFDQRESNVIDGGAPCYNVYQCSDGKWLSIAALETPFYRNLLQVLADARAILPAEIHLYLARQWQRETWQSTRTAFAGIFARRTRDEWCALFADHDACAAPVLSLAEAQQHPHNLARQSFAKIGGIMQPAAAPRLSVTAARPASPPGSPAIAIADALRRWNN